MDLKFLLIALGNGLLAFGNALLDAAENAPEMIAGELRETFAAGPGTPTIASVASAELDINGLPWDERIHASTKTKTVPGAWTKKRGLDEKTEKKVIAELRQAYPEPVSAAAPTPPAAPAAPTAPKMPSIKPPAAPVALSNYQKLCDWLAKNTGADKLLTDAWVNEAFAGSGTSLAALAADESVSAQWLELFRGAAKEAGITEVL